MKKIAMILLALFAAAAVCFAEKRPVVVVAPFTTVGDISENDAAAVTELFSSQLVMANKFQIVEHSNLDAAKRELRFQAGDWASDNDKVAAIGRVLNAQFVVRGQLMRLGERYFLSASVVRLEGFEVLAASREQFGSLEDVLDILPKMADAITERMVPTQEAPPAPSSPMTGVYKEIVIDGQKVSKWMEVDAITEYDQQGREVRRQDVRVGSVSTWERKGGTTIVKSEQTRPGYSDKSVCVVDDKINQVIYWNIEWSGSYGSGKNEHWYEYDSKGNEIRHIQKGTDGNYETFTQIQYDDKGKATYLKSRFNYTSRGDSGSSTTETWITYKDGKKMSFSKTAETSDKPYCSQHPEWQDFDESGRIIHEKRCAGSEHNIMNQAVFLESWRTYNENGDVVQIKSRTYEEDRNGKIRSDVKEEPTVYYLYEYEYHPNGKLKKKTSYYCKG